jgi:hypothetical protein
VAMGALEKVPKVSCDFFFGHFFCPFFKTANTFWKKGTAKIAPYHNALISFF